MYASGSHIPNCTPFYKGYHEVHMYIPVLSYHLPYNNLYTPLLRFHMTVCIFLSMKLDNHFIRLSFQLERQMSRLRLPSNEKETPVVKHEIKLNGILDVALLSTLEDWCNVYCPQYIV